MSYFPFPFGRLGKGGGVGLINCAICRFGRNISDQLRFMESRVARRLGSHSRNEWFDKLQMGKCEGGIRQDRKFHYPPTGQIRSCECWGSWNWGTSECRVCTKAGETYPRPTSRRGGIWMEAEQRFKFGGSNWCGVVSCDGERRGQSNCPISVFGKGGREPRG